MAQDCRFEKEREALSQYYLRRINVFKERNEGPVIPLHFNHFYSALAAYL